MKCNEIKTMITSELNKTKGRKRAQQKTVIRSPHVHTLMSPIKALNWNNNIYTEDLGQTCTCPVQATLVSVSSHEPWSLLIHRALCFLVYFFVYLILLASDFYSFHLFSPHKVLKAKIWWRHPIYGWKVWGLSLCVYLVVFLCIYSHLLKTGVSLITAEQVFLFF